MFGVGVPFYQNNYAGGIMRFSDVEITTSDFPEWVEYLYSKYMIVPVLEQLCVSIFRIKMRCFSMMARSV